MLTKRMKWRWCCAHSQPHRSEEWRLPFPFSWKSAVKLWESPQPCRKAPQRGETLTYDGEGERNSVILAPLAWAQPAMWLQLRETQQASPAELPSWVQSTCRMYSNSRVLFGVIEFWVWRSLGCEGSDAKRPRILDILPAARETGERGR